MKRYVNGYDAPQFEIINNDGIRTIVTLSLGYQGFIEYEEDVVTLDEFTDGSKEDLTHFYRYEWRLVYAEEITQEERLKIKQIQDARKAGYKVRLTPHKDWPWRSFYVLISPEKRATELDSFFNGEDDTTNKAYEISFVNRDPVNSINIADTNSLPILTTRVYYEYY